MRTRFIRYRHPISFSIFPLASHQLSHFFYFGSFFFALESVRKATRRPAYLRPCFAAHHLFCRRRHSCLRSIFLYFAPLLVFSHCFDLASYGIYLLAVHSSINRAFWLFDCRFCSKRRPPISLGMDLNQRMTKRSLFRLFSLGSFLLYSIQHVGYGEQLVSSNNFFFFFFFILKLFSV